MGRNADGAAVLTYRFWTTAFKSDPAVIGKVIRLSDRPATDRRRARTLGAVSAGNRDHRQRRHQPASSRRDDGRRTRAPDDRALRPAGAWRRPRRGARRAARRARRHGQGAPRGLPGAGRLPHRGAGACATRSSRRRGPSCWCCWRPPALVFIVACSNVANLILARSVRREGELAIRAALGASTGALRRTLLAESLLLCGAGAVLGGRDRAADGGGAGALRRALLGARARRHRRREPALGRRRARRSPRRCCWRSCRGCRRRTRPTGWAWPSGGVRHHVGHEPAAARVRRHADRRVVRAARGRRDAADDALRAAAPADRLHAATCSR